MALEDREKEPRKGNKVGKVSKILSSHLCCIRTKKKESSGQRMINEELNTLRHKTSKIHHPKWTQNFFSRRALVKTIELIRHLKNIFL